MAQKEIVNIGKTIFLELESAVCRRLSQRSDHQNHQLIKILRDSYFLERG